MERVNPKKNLGQHFLKDKAIARKIAGSLMGKGYSDLLEIGPGTGILTGCLIERGFSDLWVIEIDNESVHYLRESFPEMRKIIRGDFLQFDPASVFNSNFAVIGNFPYNISSQILFKVLEHRNRIIEVCGMLQKEVAERICAGPGSRTYGILSVLLQAYYYTELLFTVPPGVFSPPPKVQSAVIRLTRNKTDHLDCDEQLFFKVVKACFNQRRKILRNSVKAAFDLEKTDYTEFHLRPEQLSVDQFVRLTNWISLNRKSGE